MGDSTLFLAATCTISWVQRALADSPFPDPRPCCCPWEPCAARVQNSAAPRPAGELPPPPPPLLSLLLLPSHVRYAGSCPRRQGIRFCACSLTGYKIKPGAAASHAYLTSERELRPAALPTDQIRTLRETIPLEEK